MDNSFELERERAGLAPLEFAFPFPGSLTSTVLEFELDVFPPHR